VLTQSLQYYDDFLTDPLQLNLASEEDASDQNYLADETAWVNSLYEPFLSKSHFSDSSVQYPAVSRLEVPTPVRKFISGHQDEVEVEENDFEQPFEGMVVREEFEQLLIDSIMSPLQFQDDTGIVYRCESPKETIDTEALAEPPKRPRRHSIETASELIRCPFLGCGKVFGRMFNFKSHYKTHSGERPYKCEHCDRDFARNHDLKRHKRIHIGNRPFECQRCRKPFSRLDALNRHLKISSCIPQ
jgi:hypothetical protein